MADPSIRLQDPDLRSRLLRAMDAEARIPAALQALGPVTDRDVCVLDVGDGTLAGQALSLGGWVRSVAGASRDPLGPIPDDRADVVISGWTGFRPDAPDWDEQLRAARRVLRPDGRLLVVHDYGRDEVTGLFGDPERAAERVRWSRPSGPFLGAGFRIRVLHCWWQWDTLDEAVELLTSGFGETGAAVAAAMRRPRLAWKVAVYHLAMGPGDSPEAPADSADAPTASVEAPADSAKQPTMAPRIAGSSKRAQRPETTAAQQVAGT